MVRVQRSLTKVRNTRASSSTQNPKPSPLPSSNKTSGSSDSKMNPTIIKLSNEVSESAKEEFNSVLQRIKQQNNYIESILDASVEDIELVRKSTKKSMISCSSVKKDILSLAKRVEQMQLAFEENERKTRELNDMSTTDLRNVMQDAFCNIDRIKAKLVK